MLATFTALFIIFLQAQSPQSAAKPNAPATSQEITPKSVSQNVSQLQAAANSGDPAAQFKLAQAYASGNGVPQDDQTAFEWYSKAANQGYSDAEVDLAIMYLMGDAVKEDKQQALLWFKKATRQGNATAMYNLGAIYYDGDGVPVDDGLSYAWFTLAREAGYPKAAEAVQRAESDKTPSLITDGYKKIAAMYDVGDCLPLNHAEAFKWWMKAATAGKDPEAQIAVANELLNGQGVPQDFAQARHWCEIAAKEGNARGEYCLGLIEQRGLGVAPDPAQARKSYERSAAVSNRQAMKALAGMQARGEGGKVDLVSAYVLYARLAAQGDTDALKALAAIKNLKAGDWKKVDQELLLYHIDPAKLTFALKQLDSQ